MPPITGTLSVVPSGVIAWENAEYTISFDTDGGSAVASQTIKYGGRVVEPADDPTLTGYDFGGWYRDEAFTSAVNFSTYSVEGDATLYAKWDVQ